jgi:hypothetical protein
VSRRDYVGEQRKAGARADIPARNPMRACGFHLFFRKNRQVENRHGDCKYIGVVFIDADVAGSRKIPETEVGS